MPKLRAGLTLAALLTCVTAIAAQPAGMPGMPEAIDPPKGELEKIDVNGTVEASVDKGCDYMKKVQNADGSFGKPAGAGMPGMPMGGMPGGGACGYTALCLWAMLKAGVFPDEGCITKGMGWLRKNFAGSSTTTYENACVINAVEAYAIGAWETKTRGLTPAKRKKEGVKRWGTEMKGAKDAKKPDRKLTLDAADRKLAEEAVRRICADIERKGTSSAWRYGGNVEMMGGGARWDFSCTQYAMLGLACAGRLAINYDKQVLFEVVELTLAEQDKDGEKVERAAAPDDKPAPGDDDAKKTEARRYKPKAEDRRRGWTYEAPRTKATTMSFSTPNMTCAGITVLILCRDALEADARFKKRWEGVAAKADQAIYDGLAWLIGNWDSPNRFMHDAGYYLYSLERLGMFGGIDFIGEHDWYDEGARIFLWLQGRQKDGSFGAGSTFGPDGKPSIDGKLGETAFALLFLKRATEELKRSKPVFTGPR